MKALTVRQPWASLIVHGPKWIKTRSTPTKIRGRIGIIAGLHRPNPGYYGAFGVGVGSTGITLHNFNGAYLRHGPFGALIGTVELYDCVPICDGLTEMEDYEDVGFRIVAEPPYGAWMYAGPDDRVGTDVANQLPYGEFYPGRWAWLLRDPQPLAEPIPMRGAQHWQEVDV